MYPEVYHSDLRLAVVVDPLLFSSIISQNRVTQVDLHDLVSVN